MSVIDSREASAAPHAAVGAAEPPTKLAVDILHHHHMSAL
jgi:hypothetical protein